MATHRAQVRAIGRDLVGLVEREIIRLTLDVAANLIRTTPVDTGWARANWVPRIGAPFEGTAGARPPRGGIVLNSVQQQTGQAAVLGYKLRRGEVHVTNNVPYIEALNDGHSPQEPAGFVQRAIRKAIEEL